ncbi:MAG: tyrosine--tRNA ligase [Candidatus Zixiibacteriota bacterium]|nr:MAG: tyrosine--tRNA ligase [candidate division Zixibacteria bacterium]
MSPKFPPVREQMDLLTRGAQEIITPEDLEKKLQKSRDTGVPLTVKQGFDPSAPDLHLGHAVTIRKLRQFQQLGHRVVFLIGDFTGMVGDPTGKSKTRPRLTREEVRKNAETYKEQVFKILDPERTEVRFNSEWLEKLNIYQFLELAGKHTVARMLERDDFAKRYAAGEMISLLEFLYPLLQAYDSVALKADVEMGGLDQKYNLLLGRKIQEEYGLAPQVAFMMPILVGTEGRDKMSKSLNNYVGISDPPAEIYGRVMSIPDTLIMDYFTLATEVPNAELRKIEADLKEGQVNPMGHKQRLAREIVTLYHSPEAATEAEADFRARFQKDALPDHIPEAAVPRLGERVSIQDLMMAAGSVSSKSEARREIEKGIVSLGPENDLAKITDFREFVDPQPGFILKVGKKRIYRLIPDTAHE